MCPWEVQLSRNNLWTTDEIRSRISASHSFWAETGTREPTNPPPGIGLVVVCTIPHTLPPFPSRDPRPTSYPDRPVLWSRLVSDLPESVPPVFFRMSHPGPLSFGLRAPPRPLVPRAGIGRPFSTSLVQASSLVPTQTRTIGVPCIPCIPGPTRKGPRERRDTESQTPEFGLGPGRGSETGTRVIRTNKVFESWGGPSRTDVTTGIFGREGGRGRVYLSPR